MCLADVKYKSIQNVILLATGIGQCTVGNLNITLLYYNNCVRRCAIDELHVETCCDTMDYKKIIKFLTIIFCFGLRFVYLSLCST